MTIRASTFDDILFASIHVYGQGSGTLGSGDKKIVHVTVEDCHLTNVGSVGLGVTGFNGIGGTIHVKGTAMYGRGHGYDEGDTIGIVMDVDQAGMDFVKIENSSFSRFTAAVLKTEKYSIASFNISNVDIDSCFSGMYLLPNIDEIWMENIEVTDSQEFGIILYPKSDSNEQSKIVMKDVSVCSSDGSDVIFSTGTVDHEVNIIGTLTCDEVNDFVSFTANFEDVTSQYCTNDCTPVSLFLALWFLCLDFHGCFELLP